MMANFSDYDPGRLGLGADEAFARRAWDCLNEPENVRAMIEATDLGHPAVVAVREGLLEVFGDEMLIERNRQRIGHMVRQIVDGRGYEIDQPNVKLAAFPFTRATRYRQRDAFALHLFRASSDAKEVCVTLRRSAVDLPPAPKAGRWTYWTVVTSALQVAIALRIRDVKALREQVAKAGFVRLRLERMLRAS